MAAERDEPVEAELDTEAGGDSMRGGGDQPPPPADDEGTGYKRPPREHQFKPGKSGNPKGRPKAAPGLRKILEKEIGERVRIPIGDKVLSLSKMQIVVKRLVEKAMKGDQRSIEHLINLNITMFGLGVENEDDHAPLTPGEEAFLAAFSRRLPGSDQEAGFEADPSELSMDEETEEEGQSDTGGEKNDAG